MKLPRRSRSVCVFVPRSSHSDTFHLYGRIAIILNKVRDFLSRLWLPGLFLGGLIFGIYYCVIGYLPDLSFDSSLYVLTVAAYTGIFLVLYFVFVFILPAVLITFLHRYKIMIIFTKNRWWDAAWFMFPTALTAVWFMVISYEIIPYGLIGGFIISLISSILRGLYIRSIRHFIAYFIIIIIFLIWSLLQTFFISIFTDAHVDYNSYPIYWKSIIFVSLLATTATNLYFVYERAVDNAVEDWIRYLLAIAFLVIFLPGITTFPNAVMRSYKFGNFDAALMLDVSGCAIARAHKLQEKPVCRFPDVMVLSRLGSTYYLETKAADANAAAVRFTIPAKEVLSWSVIEPPPHEKR